MARSLRTLATEIAGQVGDLPPAERADVIAETLGGLRPKAAAGDLRSAANAAAGYTPPRDRRPAAREPRQAAPSARPAAARARRAGKRAVRQVRGSTFGRVFRSGLYLTGLYWLLRSGSAIEQITGGARSGLAWLIDPGLTLSARRPLMPGETPDERASAGRERPRPGGR